MPETGWSLETLELQPTDHMLEVGFGVGHSLTALVTCTPQGHVVGLDASATMIRAAGWRNRRARRAGDLALLRGDVGQIPLANQRFEKVLSIHTFYFWPDHFGTTLQLCGLLKRGGRLVGRCFTSAGGSAVSHRAAAVGPVAPPWTRVRDDAHAAGGAQDRAGGRAGARPGEIAPHDLWRTFAKLANKGGAGMDQIGLSLGYGSIETMQKHLGIDQDLHYAPCDRMGLSL